MVDKTKITSISTAKSHNDYDGRVLDAAEQAVFDQVSIPKNADGTPKIVELQEIAETLEKVIKAKKATMWDKSLYDDLNGRKTSHKYAYDAINYNSQYEAALTHLKSKDTQSPTPTPGTNEADIQAEIDNLTKSITNFSNELKKVQNQKKIVQNQQAVVIAEKNKRKRAVAKIEELKERLQNQGTTPSTATLPINGKSEVRPILLSDGTNANNILRNLVNYGRSKPVVENLAPLWKSDIDHNNANYSHSSHGRRWLIKTVAENLNFQILDYFRNIDRKKMSDAIVNDASITGTATVDSSGKATAGSGNKKKAIDLWNKFMNFEWYREFTELSDPNVNWAGSVDAKWLYKSKKNDQGKLVINNNEEYINFEEFFEFMRIVFPRANSNSRTTTLNSKLKDLEPGDSKRSSLWVQTYSEDIYQLEGLRSTNKRPDKPIKKLVLSKYSDKSHELRGVEYKNLNLAQYLGFFWDAYPSAENIFSDTIGDTDFTKWNFGISGKEASKHEYYEVKKWIKAIRDSGYSKDIISDESLFKIGNENFKFNEQFYNESLSEEGKKYIYDTEIQRLKKLPPIAQELELRRDKEKLTKLDLTQHPSGVGSVISAPTNLNDIAAAKGYIWIDGLDEAIDLKEAEVAESEASINGFQAPLTKYGTDEASLLSQKAVLEEEKRQKEAELAKYKTKGLEENITEWNGLYGSGPDGTKKYSKLDIWKIIKLFDSIKEQASTRNISLASLDADIETKRQKFEDEVSSKLARPDYEIGLLLSIAQSDGEKTKDLTRSTLDNLKKCFEEVSAIRNLEANESSLFEVIKQRIAGTFKDDVPTPTTKISEDELKTAFGNIDGVANQALADKWGNEGIKKEEIKKVIEEVIESSDRKKATQKFIDHLKGKGLDNGDKLNEKDDAEKIWKEFLGKDPERVVKTIYTCRLEDNDFKKSKKEQMEGEVKGKDTDDEEKLNMTKYGASEKDGEPNDEGMVKYLWQKAKGGSGLEYYKTKVEEKDDNDKDGKKLEGWKSWFVFGKGNVLKPCVTYIGGTALIGGILAVIFWENISNWWNGPAEEQGENKTEEDEEEKEKE